MKVHIETERLVLRDFLTEDWKAVYAYTSDPIVTRFMFEPITQEETRKAVSEQASQADQAQRNAFNLAIESKGNSMMSIRMPFLTMSGMANLEKREKISQNKAFQLTQRTPPLKADVRSQHEVA